MLIIFLLRPWKEKREGREEKTLFYVKKAVPQKHVSQSIHQFEKSLRTALNVGISKHSLSLGPNGSFMNMWHRTMLNGKQFLNQGLLVFFIAEFVYYFEFEFVHGFMTYGYTIMFDLVRSQRRNRTDAESDHLLSIRIFKNGQNSGGNDAREDHETGRYMLLFLLLHQKFVVSERCDIVGLLRSLPLEIYKAVFNPVYNRS